MPDKQQPVKRDFFKKKEKRGGEIKIILPLTLNPSHTPTSVSIPLFKYLTHTSISVFSISGLPSFESMPTFHGFQNKLEVSNSTISKKIKLQLPLLPGFASRMWLLQYFICADTFHSQLFGCCQNKSIKLQHSVSSCYHPIVRRLH